MTWYVKQTASTGDMESADWAAGDGVSNPNIVDHAMYAATAANADSLMSFSTATAGPAASQSIVITNATTGLIDDSLVSGMLEAQKNIALLSMDLAAVAATSGQKAYVNFWSDQFNDTTGLSTSTGAFFSTNNGGYIANQPTTQIAMQYAETNVDNYTTLSEGTYGTIGEAFTNTSNVTVGYAKAWLGRSTAANGIAYAKISRASGSIGSTATPGTNTPLAVSSMLVASNVGTSYGWSTFNFGTGVALTAGGAYALAFCYASVGTNNIAAGVDTSSPSFGGNIFYAPSVNSTSGYTASNTQDYAFQLLTADQANAVSLTSTTQPAASDSSEALAMVLYKNVGTNVVNVNTTDIVVQAIGGTTANNVTMTTQAIGSFILASGQAAMTVPSTQISLSTSIGTKPIQVHAWAEAWS